MFHFLFSVECNVAKDSTVSGDISISNSTKIARFTNWVNNELSKRWSILIYTISPLNWSMCRTSNNTRNRSLSSRNHIWFITSSVISALDEYDLGIFRFPAIIQFIRKEMEFSIVSMAPILELGPFNYSYWILLNDNFYRRSFWDWPRYIFQWIVTLLSFTTGN